MMGPSCFWGWVWVLSSRAQVPAPGRGRDQARSTAAGAPGVPGTQTHVHGGALTHSLREPCGALSIAI